VIDIWLLKTVLLAVGNWTDIGHPTVRRVAFSNSFAIEKHHFSFSTSGQWLWDEIRVALSRGGDPYEAARRIGEIVEEETNQSRCRRSRRRLAACDTPSWGHVSSQPAPAISLRPGQNGLKPWFATSLARPNATRRRPESSRLS
jgi:hypothetical protein